MCTVTMTC